MKNDLMELYNISSDQAVDMIYHDGLKIYSAQDTEYQEIAERILSDPTVLDPLNSGAELGYFAMDYSGRVLAVVGNIGEKKGNRVGNNATMAVRQAWFLPSNRWWITRRPRSGIDQLLYSFA